MAVTGTALHFQASFQETGRQQRTAGPRLLALTILVVLCALSLAGCARDAAQREVSPALRERKPPSIKVAARPRRHPELIRYVEPKIRRPALALLSPQPTPDCEIKRSDVKTVDPDEWARLKVEYERQCYQDAEKAARERLVLLQASSTCEIEPVRPRKPTP
jgi:hypothetical protein